MSPATESPGPQRDRLMVPVLFLGAGLIAFGVYVIAAGFPPEVAVLGLFFLFLGLVAYRYSFGPPGG